jgi:hypothetical protein
MSNIATRQLPILRIMDLDQYLEKMITKTIVIWIRNIIAPLNERLTIVWHIAALDKDVWPTGPLSVNQ